MSNARRGSVAPSSKKSLGVELAKRRQSSITSQISKDAQPAVREGDIYYRTERIFPAFPDTPDEVTWSVVQPYDPNSPIPTTSRRERSATSLDRRGSTHPSVREESVQPDDSSSHRENRAASIAASLGGETKKRTVTIWSEWSDADINAEKWDVAHKGKDKGDKGKSPVMTYSFFDDPEGKIELPQSLRVDSWRRPADFLKEKAPLVVDPEAYNGFDLLTPNEHVFESELLRWIVGQLIALWKQSEIKNPDGTPGSTPIDPANPGLGEYTHSWRPWEHIYAINKVGKGPNMPAINPHGKYVVKLYWLGAWRKIVVDDSIPFDDQGRCLLPRTTLCHELWPMLLTKAVIKIAALDYNGGNASCEFGDFSVIHCLTSWLPEAIPLHELYRQGHLMEIWQLLQGSLPEFKLPEPKPEEEPKEGEQPNEAAAPEGATPDKEKEKAINTEKSDVKEGKKDKKDDKKKDDKKDKKDKDKEKTKEKSMLQEEQTLPEHPEVIIFASYSGPPKYPVRVSVLREMANASETLRQKGLSHLYPHPVLIKQTRACPLEPPPPPEKIPAWKLIRPRKKKVTPTDERMEETAVVEKPIQSIQITSPFINYKVSPVPIPTDIHRPRSSLERGQSRLCSRPGTANVDPIEETDENAPEPEPEPPQVMKIEEPEEPKDEPPKEEKGKGKGKGKAAAGKKGDEQPPSAGKKSPQPGKKRMSSASKERLLPEPPKKGGKDTATPSAAPGTAAGKDSAVLPSTADPGAAALGGDEAGSQMGQEEPPKEEVETKSEDMWMDFEEFCKCFKNLYIYHKSHTYPCNFKNSDLKHNVQQTIVGEKRSKSPGTRDISSVVQPKAVSVPHDKKSTPTTAAVTVVDEKAPSYLFVDSLKQTEITVSYSSLSRWPDPPLPPPREESKADLAAPAKGKAKDKAAAAAAAAAADRESRLDAMTTESSSIVDTNVASDGKPAETVHPGLLVAEPYSWKSLISGQPILRLRSSGIRAAVLTLPPGRHVLRFNMTAPLGYHIHLCSSTQFVFGDEEKVMAEITKESCRFVDNAMSVTNGLGKCINAFSDADNLKLALEEFNRAHCPYKDEKNARLSHHWQVFTKALYTALQHRLSEVNQLTPDMAHAWRCFLYDCSSNNPLKLNYGPGSSRPATGAGERASAKAKGVKKQSAEVQQHLHTNKHRTEHHGDQPADAKVEAWKNREPTLDEHIGAVKVQKSYRGYRCRKIKAGRTPGTEENLKVAELLQKAWSVIEPQAEQIGLLLFRTMFKSDPDIMPKYPFYKDEWNKITYQDYTGNYPDQPPNTWFVVYREVFYVQEEEEEILCVPKLYVPIPTCMLRVINNDTGEEIPTVFQKVAPYVYKKNKKGYTFVAEARSTENALPAGKWRMRLIGSLSQLPAPRKNEVNASFHSREIRDYYVPNEGNVIFRYSVRASDEHLVSIQLGTSKPDVYVKLQVLDQEVEMLSSVGKGHVVIPACIFQKDPESSEAKRAESRASNAKPAKGVTIKTKRSGSAASRSSGRRSGCSTDDEEDDVKHKYVIQASVVRGSWPLSESQWAFAQQLKQLEKEELKASYVRPPSGYQQHVPNVLVTEEEIVAQKERPPSPPKDPKATAAKDKAKDKAPPKGKAGKEKDKGAKDKESSRPASQQFDFTKPNWILRIVSDGIAADDLEVKKDSERADEIRAMKKAWEDAEPGRAAKAMQARLKYLNKNLVKTDPDAPEPAASQEPGATEGEGLAPAPAALPAPTAAATALAASTATGLDALENDTQLTNEPPPLPTPKQVLQPLDVTPFLRCSTATPRLLDEEEMARKDAEKQREVKAYRSFREQVEESRKRDRLERNLIKTKQLELCEHMQASLDAKRAEIDVPREAFRQKFLEAERRRLAEIAAQEEAMRAEMENNSPTPKGGKKSAKKSGSSKKKK